MDDFCLSNTDNSILTKSMVNKVSEIFCGTIICMTTCVGQK